MREPSEMITASRMQNIVEHRKKNTYFATILFIYFLNFEMLEEFSLLF
jgi:hypothetical protein